MGGLGNQMFQYAFGRNYAHKLGTELELDRSFFFDDKRKKKNHVSRKYDLDIFNVEPVFATEKEVFVLSKRSKY